MVSPRTRNVPREKSVSLRVYCMRISCAMTSRWPELVAVAQDEAHLRVVLGLADAVDGRHARDDHRVAPLEHALGGRQPHLLDVLVDRRVLLDEQVALRHVGLGLVVVVVADEVLDRVLREELAELAVQLRGQRLVGREHDGRAAHLRDDVGHREGLAGAGDAQQRLEGEAVLHALAQLRDGRGLVARRRVRLEQLERRIGERDELALGLLARFAVGQRRAGGVRITGRGRLRHEVRINRHRVIPGCWPKIGTLPVVVRLVAIRRRPTRQRSATRQENAPGRGATTSSAATPRAFQALARNLTPCRCLPPSNSPRVTPSSA